MYICGTLNIGGAEKHLVEICKSLPKDKFNVSVVAIYGSGVLERELRKHNIKVIVPSSLEKCISLPKMVRKITYAPIAIFSLILLMRKTKPDIIHMFLPAPYLMGGIAAIFARVPIRIMSRRSRNFYQKKYPLVSIVETYLHKTMTVLLGNSQPVIEDLKQEGALESKTKLIYNGIETDRSKNFQSKSKTRRALDISDDAVVFIIVANLLPYKGHQDLLFALNLMKNQIGENWVLLCAGEDRGILKSLKQESISLGLNNNIRWLGSQENVDHLLLASDVGVLCSHEEGFSNSLLEYMRAGLLCIVTNVGGNSEAILDGKHGYVTEPRDVRALSYSLIKAASNPEMRRKMGLAARCRVEKNFTLDKCVDKYVSIYNSVIEKWIT